MTTAIKRRRGTTVQHATFTGLEGELTVDTTKDTVVVHDGATAGGFPLARESQATSAVAITGGSINGTTVGATTASTGRFSTLEYTGTLTGGTGVVNLGSGQFYKDASGNVGIGSSSPTGKLQVNSSAGAGFIVGFNNTSVNYIDANTQIFRTGSFAETMRIDASGNVGIGTSSPSTRLDISINNTNVGNGSSLQLEQAGTGDAAISFLIGATTEWLVGVDNSDSDKFKINNITGGGDFNNAGMTIDTSGNVGIGTSSPINKLTVAETTSASGVVFIGNAANAPSSEYGRIRFGSTASSSAYVNYGGQIASFSGGGIDQSDLRFYTSPNSGSTERMRIDSSGNLLVGVSTVQGGTATDAVGVSIYGNGSGASGASVFVRNSVNNVMIVNNRTIGGALIQFYNGGNAVGSITSNGSITLYNTTSDYRLKTVIAPVSDSGTRLDAIQPIEYDWKAGGRTRGFLAHQFAEVYPDSVSGEKDAVDKDGKPVYQGMQASTPEVMADLIAEIQSLRKRVAQLESK